MTLTNLFKHVSASFRGTDDDPPTTGTDFDNWLLVTNKKISEYAHDTKNAWDSLFETRNITPIVAGTQSYALDTELLAPSDRVTVVDTDGNDHYFTLCKPQERDRYTQAAYISGRPQTITFTDDITADSQIVGGTIKISGYYLPDELTAGGDTIPVDDPYWLVYAVASELAFNDLTYEDKASELQAKANNLYSQMASNNRRGTSDNPRTARYNLDNLSRYDPASGGARSL